MSDHFANLETEGSSDDHVMQCKYDGLFLECHSDKSENQVQYAHIVRHDEYVIECPSLCLLHHRRGEVRVIGHLRGVDEILVSEYVVRSRTH